MNLQEFNVGDLVTSDETNGFGVVMKKRDRKIDPSHSPSWHYLVKYWDGEKYWQSDNSLWLEVEAKTNEK